MSKSVLLLIVSCVYVKGCYWNAHRHYDLFGAKTPYDTVRGDIRDHAIPDNCEAVSIWTLHRHGNRNPSPRVTAKMKEVLGIKEEIIDSYEQSKSQLCAQDIENLKRWTWNSTLDSSQAFLTGVGYEELYNIGKRIQEKYTHLLQGTPDEFYFRPTNEQRTITSCMAFVHGLTDGVDLDVTVDDPWKRDEVISPYLNCDRYQQLVREGPWLTKKLETYKEAPDFINVQNAVQKRLGITTQLSADNIFAMYEICRFYRSWSANLKDPWCAAFNHKDLKVLEYYDDIKHYHRNGYGSRFNIELGKAPLKDLYEKFVAVVNGGGRRVVSYFTHDTMMEMVWSALGLFNDVGPVDSLSRNPARLWRSSFMAAFASNLIVVLNRCNEAGRDTYKVQFFINEEVTPICPINGCSWQEFQDKFQNFTTSNLSFCSMDNAYSVTDDPNVSNRDNSMSYRGVLRWY